MDRCRAAFAQQTRASAVIIPRRGPTARHHAAHAPLGTVSAPIRATQPILEVIVASTAGPEPPRSRLSFRLLAISAPTATIAPPASARPPPPPPPPSSAAASRAAVESQTGRPLRLLLRTTIIRTRRTATRRTSILRRRRRHRRLRRHRRRHCRHHRHNRPHLHLHHRHLHPCRPCPPLPWQSRPAAQWAS